MTRVQYVEASVGEYDALTFRPHRFAPVDGGFDVEQLAEEYAVLMFD